MACDVQSVETLAYADGLAALSDNDFLISLAGVFLATAGIDAQAAVTAAAANGYAKLSDEALDQALLAVFTAGAFDAQTLMTQIQTEKFCALDRRDLLLGQVAAYCAGSATTAQAIQTLLAANGYLAFSHFDALRGLLAVCASSPLLGALDWAARVIQNGGPAPAAATITAITTFLTSISSIASRIYYLNVIAPDSFAALRTPLIKGVGFDPVMPGRVTGSGNFVFSVNGFASTGDAGANGTIFDTGVNCSAIPAFNVGNGGMTLYAPQNLANMPSSGNALAGVLDASITSALRIQPLTGGGLSAGSVWGAAASVAAPANRGGIFSSNRTAQGQLNLYYSNSGAAWSSIASSVAANTTAPAGSTVSFGGDHTSGIFNFCPQLISLLAIHDGFSSADGKILADAAQALRTSFGGGFL